MGSHLDAMRTASLPTWCQTFEKLPHSHFFVMGFNEVCGTIFNFNERIGTPYTVSDLAKFRRTDTEVLTHLV